MSFLRSALVALICCSADARFLWGRTAPTADADLLEFFTSSFHDRFAYAVAHHSAERPLNRRSTRPAIAPDDQVGDALRFIGHGQHRASVYSEGREQARSSKADPVSIDDIKTLDLKPEGDSRSYYHMNYANGMEAFYIHDPPAKRCAMAAAVSAGLLDDPANFSGLAHLTEHSLFLGTKSFPATSGFDEFLTSCGGESNAATSNDHTVYFFNLDCVCFSQALKRFADFFQAPLLNPQSIWKEISAVDSEHRKNVQDPTWVKRDGLFSRGDPANPLQHFHTGDSSTLRGQGTDALGKALTKYFNANYCPPRLRFVALGPAEPREHVQAVQDTFGQIKKDGVDGTCVASRQTDNAPSPFPQDKLGEYLHMESVGGADELVLMFFFDGWKQPPTSHSLDCFEYLLEYQGDNSLRTYLRDTAGLAYRINMDSESMRYGTLVFVTFGLTPKGIDQKCDLVQTFFSYLGMVKEITAEKKTNLLGGLRKSTKVTWDWKAQQEVSEEVETLADNSMEYPWNEALYADVLYGDPDVSKLDEALNKFQVSNMNVALIQDGASRAWSGNTKVETVPHYDAKFVSSRFDSICPTSAIQRRLSLNVRIPEPPVDLVGDSLLTPAQASSEGSSSDSNSALILKIWGIPPTTVAKDEVVSLLGAMSLPVQDTNRMELWGRNGWILRNPKASMVIHFRPAPPSANTARNAVLRRVAVQWVSELKSRRLADIESSGMSVDFEEHLSGFKFAVSTFPSAMDNVSSRAVNLLVEAMTGPGESQAIFSKALALLRGSLDDDTRMPISYADDDLKVLLSSGSFSQDELSKELDGNIQMQDVAAMLKNMLQEDPLAVSSLAMGATSEDVGAKLLGKTLKTLGVKPSLSLAQVEHVKSVVKPSSPLEVRRQNPRPNDRNHVTKVNILLGETTVERLVTFGLIETLLNQAIFTELRTNRELGYICGGEVGQLSNVMYVSCYVQGDKGLPDEVEPMCEWIFASVIPKKLKMDDAAFTELKHAYKDTIIHRPRSINDELTHFDSSLTLGSCFDLQAKMLAYLESLNSATLEAEWRRSILPSGSGFRNKVVIKYWGAGTEIPPAPTGDEALVSVVKAGLDAKTAALLKEEREATKVISSNIDSKSRQDLGTAFDGTLPCTFANDILGGAGGRTNEHVGKKESDPQPLQVGQSQKKERVLLRKIDSREDAMERLGDLDGISLQ